MAKRKHHVSFETASVAAEKKRFRSSYDKVRLGKQCDYEVLEKLGSGSFGDLFLGLSPTKEEVAIKVEKSDKGAKHNSAQLRHEYKVYRELVDCKGFCSIYFYGQFEEHNIMVMDLLSRSLEDAFQKCSQRFSLRTILQIADQLLERIETLHSRHLIHRDIKPANFVLGRSEKSENRTIFAIDFGLSKRFRDPTTLTHMKVRHGSSLTGTPRYASINSHKGVEQSRRDDLESIGYVLVYFFKGRLPWQGLAADTPTDKYRKILEKKTDTPLETLCSDMPEPFSFLIKYARGLKFDEKPDYAALRARFQELYRRHGFHTEAAGPLYWDWTESTD